jgi:acetolactate synthase-1/2/3 large subunit
MQKVLNASGPVVCDLMIDPAQETLPRVSSQARPDGSMVSKPLEDLYPFLDRGEFRSNMIVKPLEE